MHPFTEDSYDKALGMCDGNKIASALLCVADAINNRPAIDVKDFEHGLCMGIRKGLFGIDAGDSTNPLDTLEIIASRFER